MRVRHIPEAEQELDEAADMMEYPHANPIVGPRKTRRKRLRQFQYGIVYRVLGEEIVVFAFMHLSRRPGYWKGRLRDFD